MAYVALKPCCFAGRSFKIGESVPDELIHPGAANNLVKMQIIAKHGGTENRTAPNGDITVMIHAEEGDMPLDLTAESIQTIFDVLTGKADDAAAIIETMTNGDALILLHLTDSRKTVKAAAEARAKSLNEQDGQESEGEQEPTESEADQEGQEGETEQEGQESEGEQ